MHIKKESNTIGSGYVCLEYSKISQLFNHNNHTFYGNKNKMYGTMLFLEGIVDNCDYGETMELSGQLPEYAIDLYIHASHTGNLDLGLIETGDISEFIKFIHQYPTTILSIDKLEMEIIEYYKKRQINYGQEIINILIMYKLKYIYVDIHNKTLNEMN